MGAEREWAEVFFRLESSALFANAQMSECARGQREAKSDQQSLSMT